MRLGRIAALVLFCSHFASAQLVAIKAGRVVDPDTGNVAAGQVILVEGGVIKAIGPGPAPANAAVIDLSTLTVLPGLVDAHTHLCFSMPSVRGDGFPNMMRSLLLGSVSEPTAYRALVGAANARDVLEAGFTTVRDVGNAGNYADTALRRAIEDRLVPGPTVINAGRIIAPFGGQFPGVLNPERPGLGNPEYAYADSRDEIRKAIRENILYGAKVIKLVVDDQPHIYSAEDIRFAVDEAARAGLKVAAHCFTTAGAHNAADAGVASIEHGQLIADEDLVLAKRNNVVLVGTDFSKTVEKDMRIPEIPIHQASVDRLKRAYKAGVTMAFGSDVISSLPGETRGTLALTNLESFVEAGVPARHALRTITTNAIRLLGVEKERGFLRPGFAADVVAVAGNPLEDILVLKKVVFVMKDGKVIRRP